MILRPALPGDLPRLTELARASKAYWGYSADFMAACDDELRVGVEDLNRAGTCLELAEGDDGIAGFLELRAVDRRTRELEALFVRPDRIGQGIGRLLMERVKALVIEHGAERLLIQSDPHAEAFYRAVGACTIGMRESDSIAGRQLPLMEWTPSASSF